MNVVSSTASTVLKGCGWVERGLDQGVSRDAKGLVSALPRRRAYKDPGPAPRVVPRRSSRSFLPHGRYPAFPESSTMSKVPVNASGSPWP